MVRCIYILGVTKFGDDQTFQLSECVRNCTYNHTLHSIFDSENKLFGIT